MMAGLVWAAEGKRVRFVPFLYLLPRTTQVPQPRHCLWFRRPRMGRGRSSLSQQQVLPGSTWGSRIREDPSETSASFPCSPHLPWVPILAREAPTANRCLYMDLGTQSGSVWE